MTVPKLKNVGASVRQRLLNHAKTTHRPFAEILQYYAMERFLYRLSISPKADQFILKGALLLSVWQSPVSRPTRDIDLLGQMNNDVGSVTEVIRIIAATGVPDDGLFFDPESFSGEAIREEADYAGVRVLFSGELDNARVRMQIDIGFGDVITPKPQRITYPALLDFPAPNLIAYPPETVVAEKLEAITKLGMLNTRMKDYFDLYLLSRQYAFDTATVGEAIRRTFRARGTAIENEPIGLSNTFGDDPMKQSQWLAFLRRSAIHEAPEKMAEVVTIIRTLYLGALPRNPESA